MRQHRDQEDFFGLWDRNNLRSDIMEIKIIDKTDNEVTMEIKGENHTLLNALKSSLLEDKHVEIATYDIEHIQISDPVLFVQTDGADPIQTITNAASRLIGLCNEFGELFRSKNSV